MVRTQVGRKSKEKKIEHVVAILLILMFLYVMTGLYYFHLARENPGSRFSDTLTEIIFIMLIYVAVPFGIAAAIYMVSAGKVNFILQLFGEPPDALDAVLDIAVRALPFAIVFATIAVHPSGMSSILEKQDALGHYLPMDATAKHRQFSTTLGETTGTRGYLLALLSYNTIFIGLGEELFICMIMLGAMWLTHRHLKVKYPDDYRKAIIPAFVVAFLVSYIVWSAIHFFAWGATEPAYYVGGIIGRTYFNGLFFIFGFLAAVFGHGFYDFILDIVLKAGVAHLLPPITIVVLVIYIGYYGHKWSKE